MKGNASQPTSVVNGSLIGSLGHTNGSVLEQVSRLEPFRLAPAHQRVAAILIAIGGLTAIGSLLLETQLFWAGLLMVSFIMVGFGLAGLLFIALQYLTNAGWSIVLRRVHEAMVGMLFPGLIGIGIVLLFKPDLYPWIADAEVTHGFSGFKKFWLNQNSWLMRAAVYAAIWLIFAFAICRHSRLQDTDGKLSHTRWNVALSALFVLLFALSYWLASVDWIMSLEPLWYSTMFGVYNFAGLFSSGIACVIVLTVMLRKHSPMRDLVSDDHLHDLGKLLLAFTTFWAYIWFCEYMLIWYANIPEETFHFARRTQGLWLPLFYLNLGLNWVIPFLALLPRAGKRDGKFLLRIAMIVLAGRLLDMYILIVPAVSESTPIAGFAPIGLTFGAAGIFILVIGRTLSKAALIPIKDPYVEESLHHHV